MGEKVSVLIPIYNEARYVADIIAAVQESSWIDEVICINDGSTDQTPHILSSIKGIKVIENKKNRGKAYAICKGIAASQGDIIVMIDADLIGLKKNHIQQLIEPIISEEYAYSIGWTDQGLVAKLTKPLTGERAYYRKDLLPFVDKIKNIGYGLELFLNFQFKDKKGTFFELKGVRQPFKEEKHNRLTAFKLTYHALSDIVSIILKSDNPASFFFKAYLPFYFNYFRRTSHLN